MIITKGGITMLKKIEQRETRKSDVIDKIKASRLELAKLETQMKDAGLPVIITFDGWSAAGKGSLISQVIKALDPRFFEVVSVRSPSDTDKRKPWMYRFWREIPMKGRFTIFDRSWNHDCVNGLMYDEFGKKEYKRRLDDVATFERQLTDDGYLIIKIFLHITRKEQKKRIEKLESSSVTAWRVDDKDRYNMEHYDEFRDAYDALIEATNFDFAPWNVIGANEKVSAVLDIYEVIIGSIKGALAAKAEKKKYIPSSQFKTFNPPLMGFNSVQVPKLKDVDLDKSLTEEEYEAQLDKYQDKLFKLQNLCYQKKIPVIICYEGWDAGGKGGNIKRLAAALDPRGYEVKPIAAPEPSELARHYLWRFWNRLENDGHFTIFDRTWYGRVMVEPIEGLTPKDRVDQAYREINEFEAQLSQWGAVVIKFWVNIDKDEQLRRFNERASTPEKQWKITDEDWRNREKWDIYEEYIDRMTELTSTENAPWVIIEGNDKKYARIKALKTVIARVEKALDNKK